MQDTLSKLKKEYALMPKEALEDISKRRKQLFIGLPKNIDAQEKRVPLTPNSVATLVSQGHRVLFESDAGLNANFEDAMYLNAGAELCPQKEDVFKANIVLKVEPLAAEEFKYMQPNQTLIAPIFLPKVQKNQIKVLLDKKITALAWEYIKNEYNVNPFMQSMSEIAGNYAIILAAKYMSIEHGKGILLGGIIGQPPSKVLIIGAGRVGESAAQAALGFGAQVQIFDDNLHKLTSVQKNLNNKVYTSVLDTLTLKKNIERADVVIGALAPKNGYTPKVVTEQMVLGMKKGAVIIDVSIDHGGCIETSQVTGHENPIFVKHGVIHYGVPNISSAVSRTASYAISNIITPLLKQAAQGGGLEQEIKYNVGLRHGTYIYKGHITKNFIAEKFDLRYTDLDLIMAADF